MLSLAIRSVAEEEMQDAYNWYEQRQPGLGDQFMVRVHDVFDRIRSTPDLYAVAYDSVRRATVRGFPYVVYYRVEKDRIVVIAVFHSSRDVRQIQLGN